MKHSLVTQGPDHFTCTTCVQTWSYRPYSKCPGIILVQHNLFKNAVGQLECRVCGQTWRSHPRSRCPQMKVYTQYDHDPLMTRFQLGYAGYEIADAHLPQPTGCYRSRGVYVLLYDPTQAIPKQTAPRSRVTKTVSDIFWPRSCIPALEVYLQLKTINPWHGSRAQMDLAEMAYLFSHFTATEIEQYGSGSLHLSIPPCLVHTSFAAFQASWSHQAVLIKSVLAAYEKKTGAALCP